MNTLFGFCLAARDNKPQKTKLLLIVWENPAFESDNSQNID
jgi:hypothetical protein